MKKFVLFLRRSLPARLSLWIVAFTALIFLTALSYFYFTSRSAVRLEVVEHASQVLENTVQRVDGILSQAMVAADNIDWLVYRNLDNPEAIPDLARNSLLNNPFLNGCSISFEPHFFPDKGQYYSIYAGWEGSSVETHQEGDDNYQYFYMDWYQLPKLLHQPCWTEPFQDDDKEEGITNRITSYCKPLVNDFGEFVGCVSVDLSLSWLTGQVSATRPYPNSYSIMIGRGGTFLVHPDSSCLLNQTIFTETLLTPDDEVSALGQAMINGEEGMRRLVLDGVPTYVFYKPLKTTGWSVAVVCPKEDIFGGYVRLSVVVLSIVVIGLLLLLFVSLRIVRRELRPLQHLANQAETIAAGRFDEVLPPPHYEDEIGQLTHSFTNMQTSLVNYIQELTTTTAHKERIENELHIARVIQMGMLPRIFPPFPDRDDVDLYASMQPAKEVGGDLYDFFILNEKLYFCIGDVSGKGIPASLLMAVARNLFRVVCQQELPPSEIARQINEAISAENEQLMFVTMFFAVVDLKTGRMDYCNCGHNPPVIIGKDGAHFLEMQPNTPIGVCQGWDFVGEHLDDVTELPILLYTDGLNEAENRAHEQFGNDRMLAQAGQEAFTTAEAMVTGMTRCVASFVAGAEASDDLTMLCVKVKKK
ncbi:MAG: SpoIIE family protein phosphatase [Bacteroidales bacterium]|nr:SpoIIE family protein phosphatase [Bacteroidales bacterium]